MQLFRVRSWRLDGAYQGSKFLRSVPRNDNSSVASKNRNDFWKRICKVWHITGTNLAQQKRRLIRRLNFVFYFKHLYGGSSGIRTQDQLLKVKSDPILRSTKSSQTLIKPHFQGLDTSQIDYTFSVKFSNFCHPIL